MSGLGWTNRASTLRSRPTSFDDDRPEESPALGRRPNWRLGWNERNARAKSGLGQDRHACPGGAPDGNGAEHGERLPPPSRGNTEICKDKGHIIPTTSRRKRKQQPSEKADNGRADDEEGILGDHQCEAGGKESNK